MIIGNIYSQKCNKNAKKNMLIYFEFWKKNFCLHFEKRLPEFKIYSTSSVRHVSYIFDYKYSQWSKQQILISASIVFLETHYLHSRPTMDLPILIWSVCLFFRLCKEALWNSNGIKVCYEELFWLVDVTFRHLSLVCCGKSNPNYLPIFFYWHIQFL